MIIDETTIEKLLNEKSETVDLEGILQKARQLKGLNLSEVNALMNTPQSQREQVYATAAEVKQAIYGNRIVFFAPLYISNFCHNDCAYCGFNCYSTFNRHALTTEEIVAETEILLKQGHKRILLVSGESYPGEAGLDYVFDAIKTIYSVRVGNHAIRRINVNIAPLNAEQFADLKKTDIGTFQLFQETYHRPTYARLHTKGPKADYDNRLSAMDRALAAGLDDVGLGVLFGLYDWRFELLAMLQHVQHLEATFGIGPHTLSIPRLEPAEGSTFYQDSAYLVKDDDFKLIIAILRLAVPYTGIILSTRENQDMRAQALALGVSQVSAGSRTNPGGYSHSEAREQFSLGDHRSLDEVILDLLNLDYLPSFCTACYRKGRTGLDFMEYAKPGDIKKKCEPNGLLTFMEYLIDFASPEVKTLGLAKVQQWMTGIEEGKMKDFIRENITKINAGARDIYI